MHDHPLVFISYAHKDSEFANEIYSVLRPLERSQGFRIWIDRDLKAGDDWNQATSDALESADIALLLVSADFLASDWIQEKELPRLLEKHEKNQLVVIPIIVRPSAWVRTRLAYLQVWPREGKALSTLPRTKRDELWAEFADLLISVLRRSQSTLTQPLATPATTSDTQGKTTRRKHIERDADGEAPPADAASHAPVPSFFISHAAEDGDFAENLKARLTQAGFAAWVDVDVLEAGTDWRKEIDDAITASRAVILVLSPDSKASEYVTYEWAYGLGLGRRIVPLLLRETPIHPRLEAFQYMDFTNRRARPWDRLLGLLGEVSRVKGDA